MPALTNSKAELKQKGDAERGSASAVPQAPGGVATELPRTLPEEFLRQSTVRLGRLRGELKKQVARSAERCERVQEWLKSAQAKELQRQNPALKQVFVQARAAAKAVPKEQAKAIAAQEKALDQLQAQLTNVRAQ